MSQKSKICLDGKKGSLSWSVCVCVCVLRGRLISSPEGKVTGKVTLQFNSIYTLSHTHTCCHKCSLYRSAAEKNPKAVVLLNLKCLGCLFLFQIRICTKLKDTSGSEKIFSLSGQWILKIPRKNRIYILVINWLTWPKKKVKQITKTSLECLKL